MSRAAVTGIQILEELGPRDLDDLTDAMLAAIAEGSGFGWATAPKREVLDSYWRGILLVPERTLLVARFNGRIAGMAQLIQAPRYNEASAFAVELTSLFVAPWARHRGLGRGLLAEAESLARTRDLRQLDLSVRADRVAAIALFEDSGYERWATKPRYARAGERFVAGHYYTLDLDIEREPAEQSRT